MHCCKVKTRFLARFAPFIRRYQEENPKYNISEYEYDIKPKRYGVPIPCENESGPVIENGVEFPPILDLSRVGRNRRERQAWHDKIKHLGTVEEKIFELNMPRYYGWKVCKIEEGEIPYDPLPQAQYITRTHVVNEPGLPTYYDNILTPETLDAFVQQIKSQVEDTLVFEYTCKKQDYQYNSIELDDQTFMDNLKAKTISEQVNRILTINLSSNYTHLLEAQADVEPRNEAFWIFGGFEPPYEAVRAREGKPWSKEWKDEPVNQCIQYRGKPLLQLRHNLPLKEIISLEDSEDVSLEIPVEPLDPRKVGYFYDRTRATIIPGFWPGDHNEFGIVSYHGRGHLTRRPEQFNDNVDAIKAQAIFGSYSWLYSQACYQGFSTFQDPTYPLVNQMVITNGQWWSFCVYQLNTTTMHIDNINQNPRRNICWITEPMKLFDSIENGNVQGLNEDVLKHLIKFYTNVPEVREGIEMNPYLSDEKVIAGIEDPERRRWLEERYKHLISNRPRHRLTPEIYHWQKIYMINHKTRPFDKRRDPWQFKINVYQRRLDEHTPEYIPKCYRPHPKHKKKWATNYYPSVRNTIKAYS